MTLNRVLFAVALGLLAHCLIGYEAFPVGDDFAYAPLTEHRANPALFPRDDQLRLFENHARVYEWVYLLGDAGPGVAPVFRLAIWVQAAATAVAILAILHCLGAPMAALPLVLGLGVVVRLDGLGRGDYGGLISTFFHHHNVALVLVLGAVAAGLMRKSWLAGVLLGMAAYGQPMTAFHGAAIAGLGAMARDPAEAMKMAVAALIVAVPAALPILGALAGTPDSSATLDLVREAYRFRAPLHYDPSWSDIGVTTLYLIAGCAGVALLARTDPRVARFCAGMMLAFVALHLVTVVVYKFGLFEWVGFFILDANRSTPAVFVIGPALALAGMWRAPRSPMTWAAGIFLLCIVTINTEPAGFSLLALGLIMVRFHDVARLKPVVLIGLATALVVLFPPAPYSPKIAAATRVALERIRAETPPDALFVIPVSLSIFRHYAQRSAYVDFKLFSVAQPDQAALTRARIEQVARPAPEHRDKQGWPAARIWDTDQRRAATCSRMAETLAETGADYYLRRVVPDEVPPTCSDLPRTITTGTLALYGPSR
ncbi:hypothetical protein KX928_15600 [Roseobacter sp. YSTF-M11]|uniref:DUF6798 domain-containing protein n=1 Tax=Roseobacter insulae TaxID=2859783 RepID=A0A9X1JZC6_9RHOB|nr:DUF6798 domain-containing protein [Roseobacter insulae]MBW4709216.1 hypothetical protein [Roseobacter insulae]